MALIAISLLVVSITGCTGSASNDQPNANTGTTGTTTTGTTSSGSALKSDLFDLTKAKWFEWNTTLKLNANSEPMTMHYRYEHTAETYKGTPAEHAFLTVDIMGPTVYEYYYVPATKKIIYAKETSTIDLGSFGGIQTDVIEVPEGEANTTSDGKDVIRKIKDSGPMFDDFDAFMHCKPAGTEQITIKKGTYTANKNVIDEPASEAYMAYWEISDAPMRLKSFTRLKEMETVTELLDWGN